MRSRLMRYWAPIPLRLMLGIAFIIHGYPKLLTIAGHDQFQEMLASMGVPLPALASWALGGLEFFGGFALVAGLLIVPVTVLLTIEMLVALFAVHLPHGFNFINITGMTGSGPQFGMPGYEVNLLYISGLVSLLLSGAGAVSVSEATGHEVPPSEEVRKVA